MYLLLSMMTIVCLLNLFLFKTSELWIFAIVMVVFAIGFLYFLKSKKNVSHLKKQVCFFMLVLALIFVGLVFLLGFIFGYAKNVDASRISLILKNFISIVCIIIACELIRFKVMLLGNKTHKTWFTILSILLEVMTLRIFTSINSIDDLMLIIGIGVFSGITKNLFFNYTVCRYGILPNVIYACITSGYAYIMPILPRMDDMFLVIIRMITPVIGYMIIKNTFEPKRFVANPKAKKSNAIIATCIVAFGCVLIGLVSCKFTFCSIVIGSESMTGAINKGDAIIYRTDYTDLEIGDVIVFQKNGMNIVHRIIDIGENSGIALYYTKGDANQSQDEGYITNNSIVGLVVLRVPYIGWPTLFVNSIFK